MKKIYRLIIIFVLFTGISSLHAQKKDPRTLYKKKADQEFVLFKYRSAIALYRIADTTQLAVIEKLALAYRALRSYEDAEHWLKKQTNFDNQPDQLIIDYAEALANNGKYSEAAKWYSKFQAKHPNDRRAINMSRLSNGISPLLRDSANWKVSFPTFNTSKDEFSPVYFNRGLIFTSNRDQKWGVKNTFGWTETPFTDLYILEDTSTIKYFKPADYFNDVLNFQVGKAKEQNLPKTINDNRVLGDVTYPKTLAILDSRKDSTEVRLLSELNTSYHDGPLSFNSDQRDFFYNRNHQQQSTVDGKNLGIFKLNMFSGNYDNGRWYNLQPFAYNSVEYSTAHPALTPDGKVLYFVSDMPGGMGGKDIYYCLREGKSWSKPINLGPNVNTEGDETFPFIASDGTLYFSSTGHFGIGGLDLFKVTLKDYMPNAEPQNLGYPINSSKDDFGFIVDNKNLSGYFSSNRYGSDDIFKFDYTPIFLALKGKVTTELTAGTTIAVPDALVMLTYPGGRDSVYTNDVGDYSFKLSPSITYTVSASKPVFAKPAKGEVSTIGIVKSTTLIKDLLLIAPIPVAVVPAAAVPIDDCARFAKIFTIENIFYDLDKFFIRPDALPAMYHLLQIMKDYPEVSVMIKSHTDSRASVAYNEKLSANRAKAAADWLVEHGIARTRLTTEYFGKRKLVNGCGDGVDCSEDIHQLNRRSEFYLFINGKNITIDCK